MQRRNRLAGDDLAADQGLDQNLEEVEEHDVLQALTRFGLCWAMLFLSLEQEIG